MNEIITEKLKIVPQQTQKFIKFDAPKISEAYATTITTKLEVTGCMKFYVQQSQNQTFKKKGGVHEIITH